MIDSGWSAGDEATQRIRGAAASFSSYLVAAGIAASLVAAWAGLCII